MMDYIEQTQTFIKDSLNNFIKANIKGQFKDKLSVNEIKGARAFNNFLIALLEEAKKMEDK